MLRAGHCGRDRIVIGFTTTIKAMSSNSAHGEVHSIQHYVIKVCQWRTAGQLFSPGTPVSSTNTTDCHDITEILLKVALNANTLTLLCAAIAYCSRNYHHKNILKIYWLIDWSLLNVQWAVFQLYSVREQVQ